MEKLKSPKIFVPPVCRVGNRAEQLLSDTYGDVVFTQRVRKNSTPLSRFVFKGLMVF